MDYYYYYKHLRDGLESTSSFGMGKYLFNFEFFVLLFVSNCIPVEMLNFEFCDGDDGGGDGGGCAPNTLMDQQE
ncbi:hypothetical protein BLOT_014668 [Blomia tropicalis]|nr:hypothetical protein BLOT_014668 [Blomia tropicalis]